MESSRSKKTVVMGLTMRREGTKAKARRICTWMLTLTNLVSSSETICCELPAFRVTWHVHQLTDATLNAEDLPLPWDQNLSIALPAGSYTKLHLSR